MEYIAVDFEWNQPFDESYRLEISKDEFLCGEIIQIGAVKMNDRFECVSTFDALVRPSKYVRMNPQVEALTGITEKMTWGGKLFPAVAEDFKRWCGESFIFITWGYDDIRVLRQNCDMNRIDASWIGKWINLQVVYNRQAASDLPQRSLMSALNHFGIIPDESQTPHNALNDALFTSMLCSRLDTVRGIEEYPYMSKYDRFPKKSRLKNNSRTLHSGFETKNEALLSRDIAICYCPICGNEFTTRTRWIRKQDYRYKAIGVCETHGTFNIRLNFRREFGSWNVVKAIYPVLESGGRNDDNGRDAKQKLPNK